MNDVRCRTCGSTSATRVGRLPDSSSFAGRQLSAPLPGGSLWHCSSCGFAFRFPLLSDERYSDLYSTGSLDVWDVEQRRTDFDLIRNYLDTYQRGYRDVVDVGCYTGQFLSSLPGEVARYGVEPSVDAAKIAASKEITIVAKTVDEFAATTGFYDIIVACDVLEHVANPLQFLQQLSLRLAPSGHLLVTTGNYDSWLWRLTGGRYWYCYFAEHISFIGPRWIERVRSKLGLKVCEVIRFNYLGRGFNLKQVIAALVFAWNRPLYRLIRLRGGRVADIDLPPGCGATKDHMLCIFQRASTETPADT
jgi:SAM-dependent methyltransferase